MFIGVEDITQSTATSGEIRVTLGDSRVPAGVAQETPIWGNGGFVSRPVDPDEAGAAQGLYINDGNKRRVIAWRDNRYAENAGSLEPGESAIVCDRDARVMVKSANNIVTLYSVNADDGNSSMMVTVDGSTGTITLACGSSFISLTKDAISLVAGGKTSLLLDEDGMFLVGASCSLGANKGTIGLMPGGPMVPIPPMNGVQYGPALGIPSTSWVIAP
ncbi:MAG: hypothetical protein KKF48_05770 [Nanoarchaeota archaeon]|nr:hypothetical protein [Nanoarchaeota archaeon]